MKSSSKTCEKHCSVHVYYRTSDECTHFAKNALSLDVGCGQNKKAEIGVDLNRNSQADVIADAHHLPFKNESFDVVRSTVVLEHSPNPLDFLREQYRILRKGGLAELTTDNAQWYRWSVLQYGGLRHDDYSNDHYMIFYPKNVERLMKVAGFKVQKQNFIRYPLRKKMDYVIRLLTYLRILRRESMYYRFQVCASKTLVNAI